MSDKSFMQLTGIAAIAAGSINIAFNLLGIVTSVSPALSTVRVFCMLFVLVFVLYGLYAVQSRRAGIVGLTGFILGEIGVILNICYRFVDIFVGPALVGAHADAIRAIQQGPYTMALNITFLIFTGGYILFGAGTVRARVFPAWTGWLILSGATISYVLMMLPINVGAILVNAAYVGMGLQLWPRRAEQAAELRPVATAEGD